MAGKKEPGKFTIKFNIMDPGHRQSPGSIGWLNADTFSKQALRDAIIFAEPVNSLTQRLVI